MSDLSKLDSVLKEIDKKYGEGSAFILGDKNLNNVERWELDSLVLSDIMGGGLPKGRIIELYGPESNGKTSVACYLAGQVQKMGGKVAFIDAEHGLDVSYAKTFGFNVKDCIFSQPDSGEQALDIAQMLAESGEVDFIVVDSVAALTPKAEIEGEMSDQQMGAQARLMGKACRKLAALLGKNKCSILFLNQIRMAIGVMYGSPERQPGGQALKFFSSIRLEIRRKEFVGGDEEAAIGIISSVKGVKNKVGTPMKKGMIKILYGRGIQVEEEYIDYALSTEVLKRKGTWYFYDDLSLGQGKDNAINYLKLHEDIYSKVKEKVKNRMLKMDIEIVELEEEIEIDDSEPSIEINKRGKKLKEEVIK